MKVVDNSQQIKNNQINYTIWKKNVFSLRSFINENFFAQEYFSTFPALCHKYLLVTRYERVDRIENERASVFFQREVELGTKMIRGEEAGNAFVKKGDFHLSGAH